MEQRILEGINSSSTDRSQRPSSLTPENSASAPSGAVQEAPVNEQPSPAHSGDDNTGNPMAAHTQGAQARLSPLADRLRQSVSSLAGVVGQVQEAVRTSVTSIMSPSQRPATDIVSPNQGPVMRPRTGASVQSGRAPEAEAAGEGGQPFPMHRDEEVPG